MSALNTHTCLNRHSVYVAEKVFWVKIEHIDRFNESKCEKLLCYVVTELEI